MLPYRSRRGAAEMTYSLVLHERPREPAAKAVGENVFLRDMPLECKVFAFYYPSAMRDAELESALRNLGEMTGSNLFVNLGAMDDPDYDKIVDMFDIRSFPVVVITATAALAAPPNEYVSAYVCIDDDKLLSEPKRAVELIQEIFNLFIRGEVAKAASKVTWTERTEGVRRLSRALVKGLRGLAGFVADRDWKVSVVEGRFEMTRHDDGG
jgi:hypothetical protein